MSREKKKVDVDLDALCKEYGLNMDSDGNILNMTTDKLAKIGEFQVRAEQLAKSQKANAAKALIRGMWRKIQAYRKANKQELPHGFAHSAKAVILSYNAKTKDHDINTFDGDGDKYGSTYSLKKLDTQFQKLEEEEETAEAGE